MIRTRALASCATAGLLTCLTLTGTAVADGTSAQLTDASFLQAVHQGNLAEIAAGLDAERHGHSGCVRDTARVLVRDHRRLDDGVRALATALHITLPAGPTAQQRAQLAAVIAKAATRGYDGAWLSLQAAGHEGVLKLIDAETTTSHNAKVIAAARAARPTVAAHLAMVRGCQVRTLGGVKAGSGGSVPDPWSATTVWSTAGAAGFAALGTAWGMRRRRATARR
ncbi:MULTISPECIES: DUF4142 domain-containing protein [Streptomycetaceae]|uniref:DUF4142 domain-containing protein n=1 Tax=Streptantibioticus cattleyicolor (strain ATCC 35852 / DSM 46488 / JCM 4925 / NBRC 14057 / NRRL 8057) TaxID=1003195 RepID=F8JNS0_STREN|nr:MULTISPECIES: DUF4142 domain-containing protein [Streptomycetaceae]AEW92650.1 hypothetical protein SCATT_02790 [Streptantibioticus cattleyicolor NRRL 8057 = DSM 46488]MYS57426.1 DUF4142 domain-containing protein [Streptomyces sp. SID5468]CCB73005.1 putative Predicted outer membrane protein [Streptantibioticus cattleyicolor NRRL 8057 = DSM 46488]